MSLTIEQFVTTGFGWTKPSPNSQKNYRNHIMQFEAFLKERNKTAQDGTVSNQDILDYIEQLKSKYQTNTVAVKVAAIKSYFRWLNKQGLTYQPTLTIRPQKQVKITHNEMNDADLQKILTNMQGDGLYRKRDLAMFSLIIYCGFKTEELAAINTENVDFQTVEITTRKEKRSFRAALAEMQTYADAKLAEGFCWQNLATPFQKEDEKEPFFLNKHRLRISARSIRRRLMLYTGGGHQRRTSFVRETDAYNMRDLRHTYLKNLGRIEMERKKVGV